MTEKCVMIDIQAVRQSLDSNKVSNVSLVATEHKLAQAMTTAKNFSALLSILDNRQAMGILLGVDWSDIVNLGV